MTFQLPGVSWATGPGRDARCKVHDRRWWSPNDPLEFTYSGYKDWNNPLNLIEVFYAGKMVEKKNGAVVRDLTTDMTEKPQLYSDDCAGAGKREERNGHSRAAQGRVAKPDPQ